MLAVDPGRLVGADDEHALGRGQGDEAGRDDFAHELRLGTVKFGGLDDIIGASLTSKNNSKVRIVRVHFEFSFELFSKLTRTPWRRVEKTRTAGN